MTCGAELMSKSLFYPPQTSLVPNPPTPKEWKGWKSWWPLREIRNRNLESGAYDSRCLLQLRYDDTPPCAYVTLRRSVGDTVSDVAGRRCRPSHRQRRSAREKESALTLSNPSPEFHPKYA